MTSNKLADGSGEKRGSFEPACVRALDAYLTLGQQVDRLDAALDEITETGVVRHHLGPEDSLVIALDEFATACDDSGSLHPPKKS